MIDTLLQTKYPQDMLNLVMWYGIVTIIHRRKIGKGIIMYMRYGLYTIWAVLLMRAVLRGYNLLTDIVTWELKAGVILTIALSMSLIMFEQTAINRIKKGK